MVTAVGAAAETDREREVEITLPEIPLAEIKIPPPPKKPARAEGWYWVMRPAEQFYDGKARWQPAHWDGAHWLMTGHSFHSTADSEAGKIGPLIPAPEES